MEKIAVNVSNYTFTYPDGRKALDKVSFVVREGESLGIIGANGAGKTTLLFSIVGILRGKGNIKVKGVSVSKRTLKEIRKKIGFVFQDPEIQLFSPTVFEDVAFGPLNMGLSPDDVKKRVKYALSVVGLSGFEERIIHHLSTGEKKRVALAGILSMDADILLLDEPTSGLDPRGRRELIELLSSMNKTMILATHDLPLVESLCHRVIILKKGQIVWEGQPSAILQNSEKLRSYGL